MSDTITIKVEGLAQLEKQLKELSGELANKALKKASMAGAEVFRKEASLRAPVGPDRTIKHGKKAGKLAKHLFESIFKKVFKEKKSVFDGFTSGTVWVKIGWRKKAFWGMFNEFGTSKMPAHPFMRVAFDTKRAEVIAKFVSVLKDTIRKYNK